MATAAQVTLVEPARGALDVAQRRLSELEARWSRFLEDSDITRLNTSPDHWVAVSADTIALIQTMQVAHGATHGSYDPTLLSQLMNLGYTTSVDDPSRRTILVDLPCLDRSVHDVMIDPTGGAAALPAGLALDPGGIGKGLAADLVVTEIVGAGTAGALVSVGGDIAAYGEPPTDDGWLVHVEDPRAHGEFVATFGVSAGGVATSSTLSRRSEHGGVSRHHTIDPLTGESSKTDLAAVTVVANSGWLAEVHATATLLRGSRGALSYLVDHGLSGLVCTLDGRTLATDDLADSLPVTGRVS